MMILRPLVTQREDPRNDAFAMRDIFKGVYNVKRLSPGWVSGVRPDGKLLEHDCTALGGNSGSVVLNLATGKVCGSISPAAIAIEILL